jgi:hypothetical protein
VADSSTSGRDSSAAAGENAAYLKQKLVYTPEGDKLLDADGEEGRGRCGGKRADT